MPLIRYQRISGSGDAETCATLLAAAAPERGAGAPAVGKAACSASPPASASCVSTGLRDLRELGPAFRAPGLLLARAAALCSPPVGIVNAVFWLGIGMLLGIVYSTWLIC